MGARAVSLARNLSYRIGVFIAALVGGMIGTIPVGTLGLAVPFLVIMPLALLTGGLLSGISASWAEYLLAPDRTRNNLLPIATVSVAVVAIAVAAGSLLSTGKVGPNLFMSILLIMASFATFISFTVWSFRPIKGRPSRALMITIGLVGTAVVVIAGTVFATCSLIQCGP